MADPLNHFSGRRADPLEAVDGSAGDSRDSLFPKHPTERFGQMLLSRLKDFVRTHGPRYLITGAAANVVSIIATNLFYYGLKSRLGVVFASLSTGFLHALIIYSGHYFFTFESRQNFLRGFVKSITANVPLMIVFNAITIYVLEKEWMSLWLLQIVLICLSQAYGITVNLFWVFSSSRPKVKRKAVE